MTATSGTLSLAMTSGADGRQVLVEVVPPSTPDASSGGKRAHVDICCVIDISGSMSQTVMIPADPTTGAAAESTGLCCLDIVKHAIQTMMATMDAGMFAVARSLFHSASLSSLMFRRPDRSCYIQSGSACMLFLTP